MSGVDSANQFPNSRMAGAVRAGQSRFVSVDTPGTMQTPSQENVSIVAASALAVPPANAANGYRPTTYAIITAIGGPLYATYDGSVPSAGSYAIALADGASLPVQGSNAMASIRVIGTNMSVSYWS